MLVASPCDILHGLLPSFCSSLFLLSISSHWVSQRLVSVKLLLEKKKSTNTKTSPRNQHKGTNLPLSQPPKENIWDLQSKKTYPAEKWIVKSWARYQMKMQIDLLQSAVDLWPFRDKHGDLLPLKRWRWETGHWEEGIWDPPRFGWWSLGGGRGWEWEF